MGFDRRSSHRTKGLAPLFVEVEPELLTRFRRTTMRRRLPIRRGVEQALRAWLGAPLRREAHNGHPPA